MMALWKLPKWTTNLFESFWILLYSNYSYVSAQTICNHIYKDYANIESKAEFWGQSQENQRMNMFCLVLSLSCWPISICGCFMRWSIWIVTTQWQKSGQILIQKYQFLALMRVKTAVQPGIWWQFDRIIGWHSRLAVFVVHLSCMIILLLHRWIASSSS